jgi:hypothetical protein
MARSVTIYRKLVTVEWERSVRFEAEEIEALPDDNPMRPLLLAALEREPGAEVTVEVTAEQRSELSDDDEHWSWKSTEVIEDRIEQVDIATDY